MDSTVWNVRIIRSANRLVQEIVEKNLILQGHLQVLNRLQWNAACSLLCLPKLWFSREYRCEEVEKFVKRAFTWRDNEVVVVRGYQYSNLHVIDATENYSVLKIWLDASKTVMLAAQRPAATLFSRETAKSWCKLTTSTLFWTVISDNDDLWRAYVLNCVADL